MYRRLVPGKIAVAHVAILMSCAGGEVLVPSSCHESETCEGNAGRVGTIEARSASPRKAARMHGRVSGGGRMRLAP